MKKTIMAILMIALMIVPMVAFVQAQGQGPGGSGIITPTNGILNVSLDRDSLKQQIKDCLQNTGSDCSNVKEMGKAFASGIIAKFCGNADQKLEQMRTRVENARGLTDEEKELFMETIRNQKEKFKQTCDAFEKGAKDKEAIKETAKQLRTMAKEMTAKTILAKEKIQERRVGLILERAGQLEAKLERFQLRLNESNSSCTREMEQLRSQFRLQLHEANGLYNESVQIRERLMNGNGTGNISGDIQQSQQKMQQAQSKLQEAQKTLKQIIVQLRQCSVNISEENETEPEEPEEIEEENETEE